MTKIRFTFFDVVGNPLKNMEFTLLLNRASFNEEDMGVILPESILVTTDEQGQAIVELWPLKAAYKIRIAEEYEELCGKLNWSFYVPRSTEIVDAQHLFLVPPPRNIPWDEEAIGKINQAVVDSNNSAVAAGQSAIEAKASADFAAESISTVAEYARQAEVSNVSAGNHATAAEQSKDDAALSAQGAESARLASEGFRDEAQVHADAALQSANTSTVSASQAADSATQAGTYATQSKDSADAAKLSETAATQAQQQTAADVIATGADKQQTAADVATTQQLKADTTGLRDQTKTYRDEALAALGSITGVISDGGAVDLSGGAYPVKPTVSTMWRVTVAGTVGSTAYNIGDQLFYTKDLDVFYKLDGTENVHSVAGKIGDVLLDKADVGLPNVNNTADTEKPVSTPQAAALALKQDKHVNLDGFSALVSAANLFPFFSGTAGEMGTVTSAPFGRSLLAVATSAALVTAAGLTSPAMAASTIEAGDLNGMTGAGWLSSIVSSTVSNTPPTSLFADSGGRPAYFYVHNLRYQGNCFQLAYPYSADAATDSGICFRSLFGATWTPWKRQIDTKMVIDSLVSTSVIAPLSANQGKVLNDAVALRYTKTESDARYYTQTQVTDLLASTVSQEYIEGLKLTWVTGTSISISAGSAYVPSVGKRVQYAGGSIVPTGVADINTFVHLYLNAAGTIFQSLTAPQRYYNTAWQLGAGSSANRYIASLLVNTNAAGVYKFRHNPKTSDIWYIHGDAGTSPFRLLSGQTSGVGSFQTRPVIPVTGTTLKAMFQNTGTGNISWTPSDAGTSITTGFMLYSTAPSMFFGEIPTSGVDGSVTFSIATGGVGSVYCNGYNFER